MSQRNGKILLNCHSGCTVDAITSALGIKLADLFQNNGAKKSTPVSHNSKMNIVAVYPYHDAEGKLLFEVCRLDPKDFRARRTDPKHSGKFIWNLTGVERVPYRLSKLITAVKAGETVFIAEGEKDVASLVSQKLTATCNAGGAGKWPKDFANWFEGAKAVVIIEDKDVPGRKHAAAVAVNLRSKAQSVKVIKLPDVAGRPVKDAHDFFEAGGTIEKLYEIVQAAKEFEPPAGQSQAEADDKGLNPNDWFKKKFPGLAGKYGEPVSLISTNDRLRVRNLKESFIAATLGLKANPDTPTVYLHGENRFYSLSPKEGIYLLASEEEICTQFSDLLLECARACKKNCDVEPLEFSFCDHSALVGTIKQAKSVLAMPDNFFAGGMEEFLPVGNGILRVNDRKISRFSPYFYYRNKLAVDFISGAKCPTFETVLLGGALDADDIGLLQRWSGLSLISRNISQAIPILSGTAGAGKGTFVRVLERVIGEAKSPVCEPPS